MNMTECIHQGIMMKLAVEEDHCQVDHLQINFYNLFVQLPSSIIGFNVSVKFIQTEQVYTKRIFNIYSGKFPNLFS